MALRSLKVFSYLPQSFNISLSMKYIYSRSMPLPSTEAFSGFKDQNGNFLENLKEDIKAILSLYEASFLALEGENILDEAKVFAISHLKELSEEKIGKELAEQVNHALELPLHRRTQRLEAVWSIEAYRKKEDANQVLLELAILDYNMIQSVYQRDLRETSRSVQEQNFMFLPRSRKQVT